MDGSAWMQGVPNLSEFYFGAYGSMFGDDPNPEVRNFMDRFVKKFGKLPVSSQAMTGYAVVQAFAMAVERAGGTGGKMLVAELEKFKGEKLLVGPTTFSKDLHINLYRGQLIMKVQNGKHSAVEWYAPVKVPAPKL